MRLLRIPSAEGYRLRQHGQFGLGGTSLSTKFAVERLSAKLHSTLTDELRAFVDQNSGKGTPYLTPSEFVRQVREKKERLQAAQIRDAILNGYQDAIEGRTTPYRVNLRRLLEKAD
jgi:antitoxin ParD1/3/4